MLTIIHKDKQLIPAIFCQCCSSQIKDYRNAFVVATNDSLVSKTKIVHKDCFRETDQAFLIMALNEYLVGLLRK